jgi:hypothetical protein
MTVAVLLLFYENEAWVMKRQQKFKPHNEIFMISHRMHKNGYDQVKEYIR